MARISVGETRAENKEEARLRVERVRLQTCPGCKGMLEPVVFFDDNPAPDNHDNPDGSRPALAIFGWCGCTTLRPIDPAGWRRAGTDELKQKLGAEAAMYLEQAQPPAIVTCHTCGTRIFPVLMYEPGLRGKWTLIGERCDCVRAAMDAYWQAGGVAAAVIGEMSHPGLADTYDPSQQSEETAR